MRILRYSPALILIPLLSACMQSAGTDTPFGPPADTTTSTALTGTWIPTADAPFAEIEVRTATAGDLLVFLRERDGAEHRAELRLTRLDERRTLAFARENDAHWRFAVLETSAEGVTLILPEPGALRDAGLDLGTGDNPTIRDTPEAALTALRSPEGESALAGGTRLPLKPAAR